MEKKEPIFRKVLVFSAIPIFILLLLFIHHQQPFSVYSVEGQQNFGNRRNGVFTDEADYVKLHLKLRRLVRGIRDERNMNLGSFA
ncbi:Phospholipid phosphatase-related protein type 1 [Bienertia sinuspersici]